MVKNATVIKNPFQSLLVQCLLGRRYSLCLSLLFLCALIAQPAELAHAQSDAEEIEVEEMESGSSAGTEINVKNADIETVIRIFSRRTKRNYILDERVKGKISIFLPGKVPDQDAAEILEAVLNLKGFASVPINESLWKIVPSKEAIQSTIPTQKAKTSNPGQSTVTRLVQLKHVSSDEVQQLISPLVSSNGLINAYTGTNSLILIDSERNIARVLDIVAALDVPFSNRELSIVPIKHADAGDIAEKLKQILSEDGEREQANSGDSTADRLAAIRQRIRETSSSSSRGSGSSASGGSRNASAKTVGQRSREPKIIPDERTNAIILVADEGMLARLRALIATLDSEQDLGGFRFWVYRCKHADAEELADVLAGLGGGGAGGARGSLARNPDVISGGGSLRRTNQQNRTQQRLSSQQRTPGQARNNNARGGVASAQIDENISVTADPATNSLVIFADRNGYQKVLKLLEDLDIRRRQVLVEAILLEVQVNDSNSMGFEWISSGGGDDGGVFASNQFGGNLQNLFANPTALSNFSVAAATAGTLTLPGGITIPTQSVLLNAARNNNNVNVLSAPTILATDNQEAEIVVGENVPFLASTGTNGVNLENTFNQIDRQDVGITLRLTPQISSDDTVRLELFTEVSSINQATASSALGPTTSLRTSQTTVVARDNQMVVTGGLMQDSYSNAEDGAPFLQDIPILGSLFGQRSTASSKSNLLIFITPRVIKDQFDARSSTKKHSGKLEEDIETSEVYPLRREVLRSEDMDNVAEVTSEEPKKLGTIRPPKPLGGELLIPEQTASMNKQKDLLVRPKFQEPSPSGDAPKAVEGKAVRSPEVESSAREQLVVLRVRNHEVLKTLDIPFKQKILGNLLMLKIGAEAPAKVRDFFLGAREFSYEIGQEALDLQRIADFSELKKAAAEFPELSGTWHSITPFEILRIGQGPWKRRDS